MHHTQGTETLVYFHLFVFRKSAVNLRNSLQDWVTLVKCFAQVENVPNTCLCSIYVNLYVI